MLMTRKLDVKTIVLKKTMSEDDLYAMIEEKKADNFRSMLRKPGRDKVVVESVTLNYECIISVSGIYEADYFRKATHTLSVDGNVDEVVFGEGVFPVRPGSNLRKKLSGRLHKNKVDLPVEEHVHAEVEGKYYFDSHGGDIRPSFKTGPSAVENYPDRILANDDVVIIESVLSEKDLVDRIAQKLKPDIRDEIRDLCEKSTIKEIIRIYVPIYEVVLFGPKRKSATMRIDAVRRKVI